MYFLYPIGSLEPPKVLVKLPILALYDCSEAVDVFVVKIRGKKLFVTYVKKE